MRTAVPIQWICWPRTNYSMTILLLTPPLPSKQRPSTELSHLYGSWINIKHGPHLLLPSLERFGKESKSSKTLVISRVPAPNSRSCGWSPTPLNTRPPPPVQTIMAFISVLTRRRKIGRRLRKLVRCCTILLLLSGWRTTTFTRFLQLPCRQQPSRF